jgi:hypothetical protein
VNPGLPMHFQLILPGLLFCVIAPAQTLTITDVVNAGSRIASASASGGIPQGAVFIVSARGIGPATVQQAAFPLPTADGLAGVTMQIASQGAVIDAIMVYVAPNEAAAILPSMTPLGQATLTVNRDGIWATKSINVIAAAFGTFVQVGTGGQGTAVAFNVNDDGSTAPNSRSASVQPGHDILINGTGLGAITSDETQSGVTDTPATDIGSVRVYVGAQPATVVSAARGACCDGLDPNFRIPQGIAAWDVIRFTIPDGVVGCFIPVVVQIGKYASNLSTVSIDPSGADCSLGTPNVSDALAEQLAGKTGPGLGSLGLGRTVSYSLTAQGAARTQLADSASATFVKYPEVPASLFASDFRYVDHVCTIGSYPTPNGGYSRDGQQVPIVPLRAVSMDAGPAITIKGPAGTRTINRQMAGAVVDYREQANFGNGTPGNYLDPGSYTLTAPGGKDVGAFTAMAEVPSVPFLWSNPVPATAPFDRSKDYTFKWTGGIPGTQVVVTGASGTGAFLCAAPVEDGQFTVPSWVFLSIPPSGTIGGALSISNGSRGTFTAPGADIGVVRFSSSVTVSLKYQ